MCIPLGEGGLTGIVSSELKHTRASLKLEHQWLSPKKVLNCQRLSGYFKKNKSCNVKISNQTENNKISKVNS